MKLTKGRLSLRRNGVLRGGGHPRDPMAATGKVLLRAPCTGLEFWG